MKERELSFTPSVLHGSARTPSVLHGSARHRRAVRECDACDALWSSEKGVSLAIKVADCLPVSLTDVEHGVIANVHSGWRGAVQQITVAALDAAPLEPSSGQSPPHQPSSVQTLHKAFPQRLEKSTFSSL